MSSFTTPLEVSPNSNGREWTVLKGFDYHIGAEDSPDCIHVPEGFVTDFASTDVLQFVAALLTIIYAVLAFFVRVPAWAGLIFMVIILAGIIITPYGKQSKPSVLHDWLYQCKVMSRKKSDQVFREAMCVTNVHPLQCAIMYYAVRCFGFLAWKKRRG